MRATLATLKERVVGRRRLWLAILLGFPAAYYLATLGALVLKFGALPNYAVLYDWPGSVAEIVRATPAVSDMLPIIADEWLLEVGYMNYDYGNGISEWNLSLMPAKMLAILLLGALLATNVVLLLAPERACSRAANGGAWMATGFGTGMVSLASITLYWVVCCSMPTWTVGLVMLGVGLSTADYLEDFGPWLNGLGFLLLLATTLWLAARRAETAARRDPHRPIPPARQTRSDPI